MFLNELTQNETAVIKAVGGSGALRQHFLDMGMIPGAAVTMIKTAPMGDPTEFRIHGYELTLRNAEAAQIEIEKTDEGTIEQAVRRGMSGFAPLKEAPHPGHGEVTNEPGYKEAHSRPLTGTLTFALAGNQNSGKTTLFNRLTGSNQHVGNFPGVTVDRKSGSIKGHPDTDVVDLPGIYSLSPYSSEEMVSRRFILDEKPTAIINIVDATNIQRNLYLTMQLMELDVPMVLALNMMDELEGNGGSIRINEMEHILGMPVVPISAIKGQGIEELIDHAIHIARYQERPGRKDFCEKDANGGAVHRCLHGIMHLIEDHAESTGIPARFAVGKIVEGDTGMMDALGLTENEREAIEHLIVQMEDERGLDRAAAMADMRFLFIEKLCAETVVKPHESKEQVRSKKLDKSLTGKFTAIPIFIGVMALIFLLTFNVIGAWLQDLVAGGVDALRVVVENAMVSAGVNDAVQSLVLEGVFEGVGSVISFVPVIVVLFFFLSILEDSGYMARVAFVMDKLLRKIGLSGRSIVPMLMGFGCTVPAVMATRTLPSERDRKLTIILTPFMSCSAKVPIYAFLASAFFPGKGGWVMIGLYFFGILTGIIMALLFKNSIFKGEAVPFVMELPNYRMPGPKNVLRLMWDKAWDFLRRAFTVIFIGTLIIWFLKTFDFRLNMVESSQQSILAVIAGMIAPVLAPLGLGTWQIATALIAGFMAKESVVSVLSVVYGGAAGMAAALVPSAGLALMVFCLLYTPCIAAVASVKRELGAKWAAGLVVFQCAVAWVMAFLVHLIAIALLG
ncbi:MAG: ferrous iron transport protein B [Eubacterium sp.]|nr:ferrous iron transport protein B [Eubacterium sp.]